MLQKLSELVSALTSKSAIPAMSVYDGVSNPKGRLLPDTSTKKVRFITKAVYELGLVVSRPLLATQA